MHAARTPLDFLAAGDVEGLLAHHRSLHGGAVMTAPPEPSVTVPAAPPAPPAPVQQVDLNNPAVQAAIQAAVAAARQDALGTVAEVRRAQEEQAEQLRVFQEERQANLDAATAAAQAEAAAREEARVAELSFSERLAETEQRFTSALEERTSGLQQQIADRDALIAKERQFSDLMAYREQAIRERGGDIAPALVDLVRGNTPEEIEASISAMTEKSNAIFSEIVAAQQGQFAGSRGVGVTAPPVGPSEINSGYETFTQQQLQEMDMETYAQNRGRLLGAASNQQRDRGMFG